MTEDGKTHSPKAARPCVNCGKPSTDRYRPFCSQRCADVDLARWLGGRYAIPVAEEDDSNEPPPSERAH